CVATAEEIELGEAVSHDVQMRLVATPAREVQGAGVRRARFVEAPEAREHAGPVVEDAGEPERVALGVDELEGAIETAQRSGGVASVQKQRSKGGFGAPDEMVLSELRERAERALEELLARLVVFREAGGRALVVIAERLAEPDVSGLAEERSGAQDGGAGVGREAELQLRLRLEQRGLRLHVLARGGRRRATLRVRIHERLGFLREA